MDSSKSFFQCNYDLVSNNMNGFRCNVIDISADDHIITTNTIPSLDGLRKDSGDDPNQALKADGKLCVGKMNSYCS